MFISSSKILNSKFCVLSSVISFFEILHTSSKFSVLGRWSSPFASVSARSRCACTHRTGGRASPSRGPKVQHICVASRPLIMAARFCCLPRATTQVSDPSPPSDSPLPPSHDHEYRRPRPFPRLLLLLLLSSPPSPSVRLAGGARGRSKSTAMAAVKVDKATNELLLGPDWTLNIDICDAVNSDHGYVFLSQSPFGLF